MSILKFRDNKSGKLLEDSGDGSVTYAVDRHGEVMKITWRDEFCDELVEFIDASVELYLKE